MICERYLILCTRFVLPVFYLWRKTSIKIKFAVANEVAEEKVKVQIIIQNSSIHDKTW